VQPYLSSSCQVVDASELIDRFGKDAGGEARRRAGESRDRGNHIHFCRWRQVERLVAVMADGRGGGTLH